MPSSLKKIKCRLLLKYNLILIINKNGKAQHTNLYYCFIFLKIIQTSFLVKLFKKYMHVIVYQKRLVTKIDS